MIILSKKGHCIHAFLVNLAVQCGNHSLFVVCGRSINIITDVIAPRSSEFASHSFDYSFSSATIPLVSPILAVSHGIDFSICNHHYLHNKNTTLRPEPPAVKFVAFKVRRRFCQPWLTRELLVAIFRGLLIGYFFYFLSHAFPLKSKACCQAMDPMVTEG